MRLRVVVFASLLASSSITSAHADSIREALAAAYNHNAQLNAQRAATRAVDENLAQAKAGKRPTVTANADYGFTRTVTTFGGSDGANPMGFGITINQNIFDGFRTLNRTASAEAGIRASREQLRNVEQQVLQSAAAAYVDVIVSRELLSIRRQNLTFLAEQLRSSRARLEVGEGTRTDVAQSEAQLAAARAQVAAAEAQLSTSRANYFQLIGRQPSGLSWPKGPSHLYPRSLGSAQVAGVNNHPAVRLALYSVDAAAFNVKVQEGAFLPTIGLQARANQRFNSGTQGNDAQSLDATISLTVPLYQGGAASSQVRQTKELLAQRRIEVDQSRDQVNAAVAQAWHSLKAARANVVANREQVRAAKLALSGAIEERNVGQRTQLDVLLAQSTVLNARVALVQSRQSQVNAGYGLVSAVGKLNSRKLGLPVRHYSPKEHYKAVKDLWFGLRTPSGR